MKYKHNPKTLKSKIKIKIKLEGKLGLDPSINWLVVALHRIEAKVEGRRNPERRGE
jgi:hypothetical protein